MTRLAVAKFVIAPALLVLGTLAGIKTTESGRPANPLTTRPGPSPQGPAANCRPPYLPSGPWNTPVAAGAAITPNSRALVATIGQPLSSDPSQYTYPIYAAAATRVGVYVQSRASLVSAAGLLQRSPSGARLEVPLPLDARPAAGSDGQIVVVDPRTGDEWGFWQFFNSRDPLTAAALPGSGSRRAPLAVANARADYFAGQSIVIGPGTSGAETAQIAYFPDARHIVLARRTQRAHSAGTRVWGVGASNGYHYSGSLSGAAPRGFGSRGAGVPYLAGLVRPCEIAQGRIDHALAFAYPRTTARFVYPASKSDGQATTGLPEGSRLQLDPSIGDDVIRDGWGCRGACFTIAKALQRYGMYLIDTSGRPKLMVEYEGTARWGGAVTAHTPAPIPIRALRVLAPAH